MSILRFALRISRFRFWFYIAGPYTVGAIWGARSLFEIITPLFLVHLFFFLLPANVLLYGVNDLYDSETDNSNPKKGMKEYLYKKDDQEKVKLLLLITLILSGILLIIQTDNFQRILFTGFLFLSWFYSAKPLRFKAIPVLDSASNFLFALPGVFSFYMISGSLPSIIMIIAAFLHTTAMHLFSAIPDIEFDQAAGLKTTAVVLGERRSQLVCLLLWSAMAVIVVFMSGGYLFSYLTIIYPLLSFIAIATRTSVSRIYWYYPYINVGLGFLLFILGSLRILFVV